EYYRKTFGIGPEEATSLRSDAQAAFNRWLQREGMVKRLCAQLDYCAKREKYQRGAELAAIVAEALAPIGDIDMRGACAAATLLIELGFDTLCECEADSNTGNDDT
ncbi:MAG TPA: hypothetical protein VK034_00835, partial [Enhygromyxa sp.]|nr:hypothetical protein [Enhygromyxa sp.]